MEILLYTLSNLIFLIIGIYIGRLTKKNNTITLPGNSNDVKLPTKENPLYVMLIEKPKGFKSNGDEDIIPKGRRINVS